MANNTIEEVIATESKANAVVQEYQAKIVQLDSDKQEQIAAWKAKSQSNLNEFEISQRAQAQDTFAAFQTVKNDEQQLQLSDMNNRFSQRKEDLVSYVVEEVKKLYGNR